MTKDHLLLQIGQRIAELRREAGLTQDQLVEQMGLSVQYLQRVEAGKLDLRILTMNNFADYLGVDLSELLVPPKSTERRPGRPSKKKT